MIARGAGGYPDGEYDCGCIYAAAPIAHDGLILIYYGGGNGLHNNWREGSLNLATLDIDRFAGYAPADARESAIVQTNPLKLIGAPWTLNAEVEPGGVIRAAILDEGGSALIGFGLEDCLPLLQGGAGCGLRWRERELAELAGQTVRLVFEFQNAKLYALNAIADRASD